MRDKKVENETIEETYKRVENMENDFSHIEWDEMYEIEDDYEEKYNDFSDEDSDGYSSHEDENNNLDFINTDAENFAFSKKFDIITCQYALFFFPNAQKALKNMKNSLKKSGKIGISVHGSKDNVPFFSSILDSAVKYIPDYVPPGTPNLDRFGNKTALKSIVKKAGFSNIVVKEFIFNYNPGKFEDYWKNYIKYIAKPLKEKLNALEYSKRKEFRNSVKEKTLQYTKKNGEIVFPWQVLILTAKNN